MYNQIAEILVRLVAILLFLAVLVLGEYAAIYSIFWGCYVCNDFSRASTPQDLALGFSALIGGTIAFFMWPVIYFRAVFNSRGVH